MAEHQALEVVRFRADVTDEFLAARAEAMAALARECPGFVSTRLVRFGDGQMADELVWASLAEAEAAAATAPTLPRAAAYFGLIDEVISMDHAEIVTS